MKTFEEKVELAKWFVENDGESNKNAVCYGHEEEKSCPFYKECRDFEHLETRSHEICVDFCKQWLEKNCAFKKGETVEVKDYEVGLWEKRIFLTDIEGANHPYICVAEDDEDDFRAGDAFSITPWKYIRKIENPDDIEITVKMNGEECKLSDISEETLLKIRENN
jgi:hypothetical protein